MASQKRKSTKRGKASTKRSASAKRNTSAKRSGGSKTYDLQPRRSRQTDTSHRGELISIGLFFLAVALFLSNLNTGIIGAVGDGLMHFQFGLFGTMAYVFPLLLMAGVICVWVSYKLSTLRTIGIVGMYWDLCIIFHMSVLDKKMSNGIFNYCSENMTGGGVLGGSIAGLLYSIVSSVGTWIIAILIFVICFLLITQCSVRDIAMGISKLFALSPEDAYERELMRRERIREEQEQERFDQEHQEVLKLRKKKDEVRIKRQQEIEAIYEEEKETRVPRSENKRRGVLDFSLTKVSSDAYDEGELPPEERKTPEETKTEYTSSQEEYLDEDMPEADIEVIEQLNADEAPVEPIEEDDEEPKKKSLLEKIMSGSIVDIVDEKHVVDNNDFFDEEETGENDSSEKDAVNETDIPLEEAVTEEFEEGIPRKPFTKDMLCDQEFDIAAILKESKPKFEAPDELVVKETEYLDETTDEDSNTTSWLENSHINSQEETIQEFNDKNIIGSQGLENKGKINITGEIVVADSLSNVIEDNTAEEKLEKVEFEQEKPQPIEIVEDKTESAKPVEEKSEVKPESVKPAEEKPEDKPEDKKPAATKAANAVPDPEPKKKWRIPRVNDIAIIRDMNGNEMERRPILKRPEGAQKENLIERDRQAKRELQEAGEKLREVLDDFGVKIEDKITYTQGPTVTRFEIVPKKGVRVKKIVNLAYDIMLGLAAASLRIEAPVPGESVVGLEIPNKTREMVTIYDMLKGDTFNKFSGKIAFTVGKALDGSLVVSDVAKMPHALIAGSTGAGKSVCINTLLISILFKYTPDEIKLIMIDPKVVELQVYNGIPHLKYPVVTDPRQANEILHQAVLEMDERYRRFSDQGVRDIVAYNEKVFAAFKSAHSYSGEINSINDYYNAARELNLDMQSIENKPMPYWVIVVDELADLMMTAGKEVEASICRIAQLARACGIHLIVATQRPSVDVITGLIKANMPSRVAFAVSSNADSRTILDEGGAEKLLRNGDMLFYPAGKSHPERIQGAFVSDQEVENVVAFWTDQIKDRDKFFEAQKQSMPSAKSGGEGTSGASDAVASDGDGDEYLVDAARFIIEKDKASIGMLQRKFKIGFNRAARIMDELCDKGVVGEEEGTKPRKVLMSIEEFENACENGDI